MSYTPAPIGTVWEHVEFGVVVLVVSRHPRMSAMSRCLVLRSDCDEHGVVGAESTYIIPSKSVSRSEAPEVWKQVLP